MALPAYTQAIPDAYGKSAVPALVRAIKGQRAARVPGRTLASNLFVALLPALAFAAVMGLSYRIVTAPDAPRTELVEMGAQQEFDSAASVEEGGLQEPPAEGELAEPPVEGELAEPPVEGEVKTPPAAAAPADAAQPAASASALQ